MANSDTAAIVADLLELSRALIGSDLFERANLALREAIQLAEQSGLDNTELYALLTRERGNAEFAAGRAKAAQHDFERSLALYEQLVGFYSWPIVELKLDLVRLFIWTDELERAEQAARDAQRVSHKVLDEMHPDRILADVRLAEVLVVLGKLNEAERLFTDTLSKRQQLFGEHSRQVADALDSLAEVRALQGRLTESERLRREAVFTMVTAFGDDHRVTAYFRTTLAKTLITNGKYDEAIVQARQALSAFQAKLPPDHQHTASAEHLLAEALLRSGRLAEAEQLYRTSIARWTRAGAPEWRAARSASGLGEALYRQGRVSEAEGHLVDSYRVLARSKYADRDAVESARERVVRFYTEQGRPEKLQAVLMAERPEERASREPAIARTSAKPQERKSKSARSGHQQATQTTL
jgi:tetratricopeptide (TPR) repeat protein